MMRLISAVTALGLLASLIVVPLVRGEEPGQKWGTVKGQVLFAGDPPAPVVINVNKDQQHCLSKGMIESEEWVVNPKNKGVRWVFVWLAPVDKTAKMPIHPTLQQPKDKEVVLDQPCCKFEPHALVMREGQVLIAKNTAPIPHNVHWAGGTKNPGNNVIIPPAGKVEVKDLVASYLPVSVKCDIHGWMSSWIRVFDHPYYALTDADGKFEIPLAPAGDYQLVVWHEGVGWGPGGKTGQKITIKPGGTTEVDKIEIKPSN
jgi:hypothetical protein